MHFSQKITLITLLALASFSCKKDDPEPQRPRMYLDIGLNIAGDPSFMDLNHANGSVHVRHYMVGESTLGYGNNGVLVINTGEYTFSAFDGTCTHEFPGSAVRLEIDGVIAKCPQCGSQYSLISDGWPASGPSTVQLGDYGTQYSGNGILRIFSR